jgi:uncharacterized protein (UPF0335 family)
MLGYDAAGDPSVIQRPKKCGRTVDTRGAGGRKKVTAGKAHTSKRTADRISHLESAVDDHLKQLMQQLGNAINESLSESENIAEVIGEIKRSGYDVFLVLEATIGFNKRPGDDDGSPSLQRKTVPTKVSFTPQDQAFLKALRITIEE